MDCHVQHMTACFEYGSDKRETISVKISDSNPSHRNTCQITATLFHDVFTLLFYRFLQRISFFGKFWNRLGPSLRPSMNVTFVNHEHALYQTIIITLSRMKWPPWDLNLTGSVVSLDIHNEIKINRKKILSQMASHAHELLNSFASTRI
jgi:hypothetical protein